MMSGRRTISALSATALEDEWLRNATDAAIKAFRGIAAPGGVIPPAAPVGRLSDTEIGWLVAAVLFAWISTRAEQATSEGLDAEFVIRATGYDPDPWDAGAVAAILPELAEVPNVDWLKSLNDWSRAAMVDFLTAALGIVRKAVIARDLGGGGITRKSSAAQIARQANAAAGGPLLAPGEFDDPIEPL